ncbi:FAD-dependent oxidoreductase [Candidatus Woesebacteria bacterium]|nr:FAD-dependent oxidoreductase [Candidatus Woesebacteria bacterium]
MKIAIIGAGITGLSTAHLLSKEGHSVTVYEASPVTGGLGTFVRVQNSSIERFYHHFFRSDTHVINLIKQLGIGSKLKFYPSKTSILYEGATYPFSSPLDLLTFKPLPFIDRLRLGVALAILKYLPVNIKKLDSVSAKSWLMTYAGAEAYKVIWKPLLVGKFAKFSEDVPAAWLRERIRDRSFDLGYLDGGSETLFNALVAELKKYKVSINLNTPVTSVESYKDRVDLEVGGKKVSFDKCLITAVSPIARKLLKNKLTPKLDKLLNSQDQLGAVCLLLELSQPIQNQYWINVCEDNEPVLVMVEHTNLIDKKNYGNRSLVYLANYLHRDSDRFRESDEIVVRTYLSILRKLNPKFKNSWIKKSTVSRVPRAQTIFGLNSFADRPPNQLLHNVFLANIDQMYPHDRNFNLGVELSKKVSNIMTNS